MARRRDEVELIVKAIAEGFDTVAREVGGTAQAVDRAGDRVGRSGEQAQQSGLKWTELASKVSLAQQAYHTVAGAIDVTLSALERGAELELAEDRFGRLSETVGTTADTLLNQMREATSGMVSDAELMASAADLISFGLADTGDGVVELATLISELGLDMQQVILTFANDSTKRLDALGLSVESVTDKAAEFEAQGIAATKAFDLAVIEALKERLDTIGSAAGTSAGQVRELRATWANMRDEVTKAFAEEVDVERLAEDVALLAEGVITLIGPLQDLAHLLDRLGRLTPAGLIGEGAKGLIRRILGDDAEQEISDVARETAAYEDNLRAMSSDGAQAAAAQRDLASANREVGESFDQVSKTAEAGAKEIRDAALAAAEIEEGRRTLTWEFDVDQEAGEQQVDDFINRLEGRALEIQLAMRGQGDGQDIWSQFGIPSPGQQKTSAELANRARTNAEQFGDEFAAVLQERLTGVFPDAPKFEPDVNFEPIDSLNEKLEAVARGTDNINEARIVPVVDDTPVQRLNDDVDDAQGKLNALQENSPYASDISSNFVTELGFLSMIESKLNAIDGRTVTTTVNVRRIGGNVGGVQGQGGGNGDGGGGGNTFNFNGVNTQGVIRDLRDRGLISGQRLR